jgi:hypothetical protein
MILNVPTAEDHTKTGLDLLNLAWRQVDNLNAQLEIFDHDNRSWDTKQDKKERHEQF